MRFLRPLLLSSVLAALATIAGCQGGCQPKPQPDPTPNPQPQPQPGPGPTPNPEPQPAPATVAGFVIVEDTAQAGQARGMFLGSPKISAFLKNSGLQHAIVSTAASDPDGKPIGGTLGTLIVDAKAKGLPRLYQLDAGGKTVKDLACPLDPDQFVATFATPHKRMMGNIAPVAKPAAKWRVFGTTPDTKVIPRAQWKEIDLEAYLPPVKDQDGVGACNAFATVTATEASREVAGLSYVKLSPGWLYGRINGGRDQGSMLEDGLAWMVDRGTCTSATVGDLSWRSNPSKAATEAKNYRVVEAYLCPTFDHLASALQQGFFIVEGVLWYDNFNPDAEGWLPARGRGSYGGHALCGYGLAQRSGAWGVRTRNSWGVTWGNGGNCVIPESLFDGNIGGWWAIRSVTRTPEPFPPANTTRRAKLTLMPELEFPLAP